MKADHDANVCGKPVREVKVEEAKIEEEKEQKTPVASSSM